MIKSKVKKANLLSNRFGKFNRIWSIQRLGNLATVTSGGTPDRLKKEYWGGTIPWVNTGLIDFNYIYETDEFITEEGLKKSAAKIFSKGTILMAMYGQGVTRGKVAVLGIDAATNQACAAIIPTNEIINNHFLFQYLIFRYELIRKLSNTGNQENLNHDIIRSIQIPLPTHQEQKAIVDILSTWDQAIDKLQIIIVEKELRNKALIQQLIGGKRRLEGFRGKWKRYCYNDLVVEIKRPVKWSDNDRYDLISVRRKSGGVFYRESLYGNQILTKNLGTALEGDFLFSKMQILHGASGLVTKQFDGMKISGSYISVVSRDKDIFDIEYLDWLSKTSRFYHQTYISSYGVAIEKMTFQFEYFLEQEITIPEINEQKAIVEVLRAATKEIEKLSNLLDAYKEQKKGLMQKLLMGEIIIKSK
jgi:type I restriction enzyme S subunit